MKNRTVCLETTDGIHLNPLGDENFVMTIEGQNFVFSFDAMYDLAVRMTMMIQNAESLADAAAKSAQNAGEAYGEFCSHAPERVFHS